MHKNNIEEKIRDEAIANWAIDNGWNRIEKKGQDYFGYHIDNRNYLSRISYPIDYINLLVETRILQILKDASDFYFQGKKIELSFDELVEREVKKWVNKKGFDKFRKKAKTYYAFDSDSLIACPMPAIKRQAFYRLIVNYLKLTWVLKLYVIGGLVFSILSICVNDRHSILLILSLLIFFCYFHVIDSIKSKKAITKMAFFFNSHLLGILIWDCIAIL